MPPALQDVILDFHWDHTRLHTLDLPVDTVPLAELAWLLDLPFWSALGVPFRVSPNEVAADPTSHQEHWQRTHSADLRYPLDAYRRRDGRLVVLDGIHRLLKASLMSKALIAVREITPRQFDAIAVPGPHRVTQLSAVDLAGLLA